MKNLCQKSPYCPNIAANTGIFDITKRAADARIVRTIPSAPGSRKLIGIIYSYISRFTVSCGYQAYTIRVLSVVSVYPVPDRIIALIKARLAVIVRIGIGFACNGVVGSVEVIAV